MRRQCPADLDLKAAPPLPIVGSGRQPVAWLERDGIDLWPGCGTGPDPNDIGSQPIEIDYFREYFPNRNIESSMDISEEERARNLSPFSDTVHFPFSTRRIF